MRVLCGNLASMSSEEGSGMVGTYKSMTNTLTFVCVGDGAGCATATFPAAAAGGGGGGGGGGWHSAPTAAAWATPVVHSVAIFAVVSQLYGFFVWLHLPS